LISNGITTPRWRVSREESIEEGMEKGIEKRDKQLLSLIDQGYTVEDLKRELSARA